jgi:hypothetical protein
MYYPIQLDKSRNFKYGMKAISLIEKKFKKPISKIDMLSLTMEEMATIIWAGLVHEDKNLTSDRVMDIIDDYSNVTKVFELAGDALAKAFSGDDPKEEEEKNA